MRRARAGVVLAGEGLCELEGAVLTVVGVHHNIAVADAREAADGVARDVLVVHRLPVGRVVGRVGSLHRLHRRGSLAPLAQDQTVVGLIGQAVVLGAVHAEVAPHDRADAAAAHGLDLDFQAAEILQRAARRRVAPVEERMDHDLAFRKLLARPAHDLE